MGNKHQLAYSTYSLTRKGLIRLIPHLTCLISYYMAQSYCFCCWKKWNPTYIFYLRFVKVLWIVPRPIFATSKRRIWHCMTHCEWLQLPVFQYLSVFVPPSPLHKMYNLHKAHTPANSQVQRFKARQHYKTARTRSLYKTISRKMKQKNISTTKHTKRHQACYMY